MNYGELPRTLVRHGIAFDVPVMVTAGGYRRGVKLDSRFARGERLDSFVLLSYFRWDTFLLPAHFH